jgi:hypothetical protein
LAVDDPVAERALRAQHRMLRRHRLDRLESRDAG